MTCAEGWEPFDGSYKTALESISLITSSGRDTYQLHCPFVVSLRKEKNAAEVF